MDYITNISRSGYFISHISLIIVMKRNISFYIVNPLHGTKVFRSIRENKLYSLCYLEEREKDIGIILDIDSDIKNNVIRSDEFRPSFFKPLKLYNYQYDIRDFIIEDEYGHSIRGRNLISYSSYKIEKTFREITKSRCGWMVSVRNLAQILFIKSRLKEE